METTTSDRWVGVGSSTSTTPGTAARDAIRAALDGRRDAALVLLFVPPALDVHVVARTAADEAPEGVEVVGCTTTGEIAGPQAGSGRLVAVALGGAGFTARSAVGELADGSRAAGEAAAACVAGVDAPHKALLLLCDGFAGGRAEIVRGAYSVTGAAVPLVGGCAGDELAMTGTFQIQGGQARTGVVVGVALGSTGPISVGIGHGWRKASEPIVVTESDGQRIFRLDDVAALDHYLATVGSPRAAYDDHDLWRSLALVHPLGLTRPGGEEIRAVLGFDDADGALICGDVPQGTVVSVMDGDAGTIGEGTRAACDEALAGLGGAAPIGVVAFDCAARRIVLGDDGITEEAREISERLGGVPLGGFYTQGEFARTHGTRGVHNATLVLLALG